MNKGFRYILNVIDCFSKYAWSVPSKNEKGETVLDAFNLRKPKVKNSPIWPKGGYKCTPCVYKAVEIIQQCFGVIS